MLNGLKYINDKFFFFRFIIQNDIKYGYKNPHNFIINHKFCKKKDIESIMPF